MTKYIKATEVAEILGLSVNSVYGLKMRGKIQPAKILINGRILFDRDEIEKIAESQYVKREDKEIIGGYINEN